MPQRLTRATNDEIATKLLQPFDFSFQFLKKISYQRKIITFVLNIKPIF